MRRGAKSKPLPHTNSDPRDCQDKHATSDRIVTVLNPLALLHGELLKHKGFAIVFPWCKVGLRKRLVFNEAYTPTTICTDVYQKLCKLAP